MNTDFSVTPKPQNKKSTLVMSLFFGLALLSLIVSFFMDRYKGVVGFVTLLLLVTAILMYTKYVSVVFHYDVIFTDVDEPLFVVRQTTGKRDVTLCRIALADIVSIEKETAAQRRQRPRDKSIPLYVYCPTLAPEISYRMCAASRFERAEIIIEGTDELRDTLMRLAAEARENRPTEEDDY